jgi:hypothetical protein
MRRRRGPAFRRTGPDRGEDEILPDAVSAQIAETGKGSAFKALEKELAAQLTSGQA